MDDTYIGVAQFGLYACTLGVGMGARLRWIGFASLLGCVSSNRQVPKILVYVPERKKLRFEIAEFKFVDCIYE